MKYPVGIQSFPKLREEGFAYVDKTGYIVSFRPRLCRAFRDGFAPTLPYRS
ncbi:MAG: AAA family ATPase [Muribaculaceae bacterium]|nr:AAA family ATPase [Muribaculaceae bacterium]